jgi:hypothetical protein
MQRICSQLDRHLSVRASMAAACICQNEVNAACLELMDEAI